MGCGNSTNTGASAPNAPKSMDIKVVYFDIYGRAEPLRLMLHSKKVNFKDERVTNEQWAKMKGTPAAGEFNCMPHLWINGKNNQQITSNIRAVGVNLGYYNQNDAMQAYIADWSVECWNDFIGAFSKVLFCQDDSKKPDLMKAAMACLDGWLRQCEEKMNAHKGGFVAGSKVSTGDWVILATYSGFALNDMNPAQTMVKDIFDKYPCVKASANKGAMMMKSYLDTRPKRPA